MKGFHPFLFWNTIGILFIPQYQGIYNILDKEFGKANQKSKLALNANFICFQKERRAGKLPIDA